MPRHGAGWPPSAGAAAAARAAALPLRTCTRPMPIPHETVPRLYPPRALADWHQKAQAGKQPVLSSAHIAHRRVPLALLYCEAYTLGDAGFAPPQPLMQPHAMLLPARWIEVKLP